MLPARFLDSVQLKPSPEAVARGTPPMWAATGGLPFSEDQTLVKNREYTNHFKYWTYIAVKRIMDTCSEPILQCGYPVETYPFQKQNLTRQQRDYLLQYYPAQWLQSAQTDLQPVPEAHPVKQLIANINSEDTWAEFIAETILFLELCGQFYWWIVPNGLGLPAQLWVIPTDWVQPIWSKTGDLIKYRVIPTGCSYRTQELGPNELATGKHKSPRSKHFGWGPLQAGARWLDNVEQIEKSRERSFKNGVFPEAIIEMGDKYANPLDDTLTRIKEKFISRMRGVREEGEPLMVPPDVKIHKWTNTPREMDFETSGDQARDNALALHGVTDVVAGVTKNINRATAETAFDIFYAVTCNPLLRLIAGLFTENVARRFDPRLMCWYDSLRQKSAEQRQKELELLSSKGAVSLNELRGEYGYPALDLPEYQTGYLPVSMRPLTGEDQPEDLPPEPSNDGSED
jgi:phage portal protein BeeE